MKLIVDRIEESIVVCENYDTKELVEIPKDKLTFSVRDGDILSLVDGVYTKDDNAKKERIRLLREKFARVKRKKDID